MKNYVQKGVTLDFVAPAGGVVSGVPVKIGATVCVPSTSAAAGESFAGAVEEVYAVPAATGQAWASTGLTVYWDDTAKVFTTTASGNTKAGITAGAKATADAIGNVKLTPGV